MNLLNSFIFSLLFSIINCQSTKDNKCAMSTETPMFVPTVTNNITARNSKSCWRRSVELCLLCNVTFNNKNNITNDIKNGVDKSGTGKGTRDLIKFLDYERQDVEVYQMISGLLRKKVPTRSIRTCECFEVSESFRTEHNTPGLKNHCR